MGNDPYKYFRIESREILENLTKGVLDIENGFFSHELLNQLFRHVHTLKGAARVVKQMAIYKDCHDIEEILAPYRNQEKGSIPREIINQFLKLVDSISSHIKAIEPAPSQTTIDPTSSVSQEKIEEGQFNTIRIDSSEMDEILFTISESVTYTQALRKEKLNDNTIEILNRLDSVLTKALNKINDARLFSVSTIFPLLSRAARDAADALNKKIELETKGGNVKLEASVLYELRNCLLHMIRNSVAHGIENERKRVEIGKNPTGKISISIERKGNRLIFNCKDDGSGIDLEAIRKVALARKLISTENAEKLSFDEAIQLLLRGGISTSTNVTEISGRGIGLDTIRDAITKLKGEIFITSQVGLGTNIEIHLPVSIESILASEVEVCKTSIMIPMSIIANIKRINKEQIAQVENGRTITFEEKSIPFYYLSEVYFSSNIEIKASNFQKNKLNNAITVVIINVLDKKVALGIERIKRLVEIVVRPLPNTVKSKFISSITFDSEGNLQAILDPMGLLNFSRSENKLLSELNTVIIPHILIIDDSLTTRMLEQSILERVGYKVSLADSGEQGLEKVKKEKFDLIIVDIEMPGMNGFQFIENTKEFENIKSIPIMMLSSRDTYEDRTRAKDMGVREYFVKGEFDEIKFIAEIKKIIG